MSHDGSRRSPGQKVGSWFDRNGARLGYIAVGLLVGLLFGWWAGSYLSCSRSVFGCELRADSISAAGTWFGAIGTVAAVLTAVAAFRADEQTKREDARQALLTADARERFYREEAKAIRITCQVNHATGDRVLGIVVTVANSADKTSAYRLKGRDFSGPLKPVRELAAGKFLNTTRDVGGWTEPAEADFNDAKAFEKWWQEQVTITFRMNGRYWSRTGHDAVELIEDWDADGPDSDD